MKTLLTYLCLENHNMFVNIRKKYVLPIKWFLKKNRLEAEAGFRTKNEVLEAKTRIEKEYMVLLRQRRNNEVQQAKGKLEFIDWLLCQEQKD